MQIIYCDSVTQIFQTLRELCVCPDDSGRSKLCSKMDSFLTTHSFNQKEQDIVIKFLQSLIKVYNIKLWITFCECLIFSCTWTDGFFRQAFWKQTMWLIFKYFFLVHLCICNEKNYTFRYSSLKMSTITFISYNNIPVPVSNIYIQNILVYTCIKYWDLIKSINSSYFVCV